ncbi:hypothetical protein Calag_1456 [Caldisphaera lagunensis DSM 15908]|uniref:UPF0201 protein Calag_1456 n=1 Tax=Caldisphaera lagunensis (strain DSM 15908 / JCM 11604 / ANMR 0165 / IC-154) TaxID=1056495 RepID=L0ADP5_CALLD|nr:RNA-binding domain-containing protein [Caldisphaera lagunensis]AFZ71160.1 hypothetical protein Calag_1456 [Caldisphaera lagunensis DSM 15908]
MENGKIIVEAELRPTEDEEKVIKAINNVFTCENMEITDQGDYKIIRCSSNSYKSLNKFHELLRRQAILDAARSYFFKRIKGNKLLILLHKQAAYSGKISFISWDEESPLGPIKIIIESKDINSVIDWLSPQTVRGKPLWERGPPKD